MNLPFQSLGLPPGHGNAGNARTVRAKMEAFSILIMAHLVQTPVPLHEYRLSETLEEKRSVYSAHCLHVASVISFPLQL